MAGDHIGKKTNDQGERLGKNAHYFHGYHDRFYAEGNRRIGDMSPIMLVRAEEDHNEGYDTQYGCKGDITCYVRRSGDQADQVVDQDEKEDGKQERHVFAVPAAQVGFADLIPDKGDDGFQGVLKSGGG